MKASWEWVAVMSTEEEVFAFCESQVRQGCRSSLELERRVRVKFPLIFPHEAMLLVRKWSAELLKDPKRMEELLQIRQTQ